MQSNVRVRGSGFTSFNYRGQTLAWLTNFNDDGQRPGVGAEAVHPLGDKYPREIVTPRFLNMGTLSMTITELWNAPVWQQLVGLEGVNDIIDVFQALASDPSEVWCQMLIKAPDGRFRGKTYHNVVITGIPTGETVEIGSLSVGRDITAVYTHTTPLP